MAWSRTKVGVVLAIASVVLSAAVGIVSNILVESWGWALLTALLVLVSCLALVEVIRHRADRAAPATTPAQTPAHARPGSITITGSSVRGNVAGRDINQTKIGTGGLAAMALVAVTVGVGTTYLGRTDAAIPRRALDATATTPTAASPAGGVPAGNRHTSGKPTPIASAGYRSSTTVLTAVDLDPPASTSGTDDVSFNSKQGKGGLSMLNGAALAPIPGDGRPSESACRSAAGYSTALVPMPISPGLSRCLHTSDGRYGALSITSAETGPLGGLATISWTVW